ncbi:hypothetical protein MTO96_025326 [Rhipicephalus appendiculatus]
MDRQKKKRSSLRAGVTKLINDLALMMASPTATIGELQDNLNVLTMKETALQELDAAIELLVEDDQFESELEIVESYQTSICLAKSKVTRRIEEMRISLSGIQAPGPSTERVTRGQNSEYRVNVKLPKLEISKFDGSVQNWCSFWDQYECSIHKNEHLSKVDKFKYLKSYLVGKAEDSIVGLSLTDSNYEIAVDLLTERFGRKEIAVNDHMSRLLHLKPVASADDVISLRLLYDEIFKKVRGLEALGVKPEAYRALLKVAIEKCLPPEIVLRYCQNKSSNVDESNDFAELIVFLKKEELRRVELVLKSRYDGKQIRVEALEVPNICNGTSFSLLDAALHGIDISIQLADDARQINGNDNIDLLIGSDYYWQVATGRIRRLSNRLTAIETLFGWTLQGPVESFKTVRQTYTTAVMNVVVRPCDLDADLSKHLEAFWDVEHMGILPAKDTNTSDAVLQEFKKTVKKVD